MLKRIVAICMFCLGGFYFPGVSYADLTSKGYVDAIVAAVASSKVDKTEFNSHASNNSNPHAVTAAQVGLGNVKNVDQTNAGNLSSGTVAYGLLPVGNTANTVAAGDDVRFGTLPTVAPTGTPPEGQVFVWFN